MHREENDELEECAGCRAAIAPGVTPSFALGDDLLLCLECAIRRGGQYDARLDRWTVAPDLSGLPLERRPEL